MNEYPEKIATRTIGDPKYRYRLTVAEWDQRPDSLVDESAYWYKPEADEFGLECWAVIDGIDKHKRGDMYDVWFASGQMVTVAADKPIYVSEKHFAAMGRH